MERMRRMRDHCEKKTSLLGRSELAITLVCKKLARSAHLHALRGSLRSIPDTLINLLLQLPNGIVHLAL